MRISAIAAGDAEQGALTEAGNVVGRITLSGTVALIVGGGIIGTAGGLIYLALRPWLADAGRWKGLLFGVMLLAVLGPSIIRGQNFDFYVFGPPLLNVATFASLFILFGLLVPPLALRLERVERALPAPSFGFSGLITLVARAFGLAFMAGSLLFMGLTIVGFGPGGPLVAALAAYSVIVIPLAAMGLARTGVFERLSDLRAHPPARRIAIAVVALPVLVGLALTVRQLAEIFTAGK